MKLISKNESYLFNKCIGLSKDISLPYNLEVEVTSSDAKVLLTYPGVEKTKSEVLNVEEINSIPNEVTPTLSIKE